MIRRLLSTVAVGLLLSAPATASATCSPPSDVAQELDEASTVFVGEVTAVADDGTTAIMSVLSIWKGRDLPGRVEVHGADATGENAAQFVAGATYLVVPENNRTPFLASICSATRPYEPTGTAIPAAYQDAVGATQGRTPQGSSAAADAADAKGLRTAALGLVSAGVIATGLLVMRLWRPTIRTPLSDGFPQPAPQMPRRAQSSSRSARRRMVHIKRRNRKL